MSEITQHSDYRQALAAIKQRIQAAQTRAVLAANAELPGLYWDIGRQLDVWQREWGAILIPQAVGQFPWDHLLRAIVPSLTAQSIQAQTYVMNHEKHEKHERWLVGLFRVFRAFRG
ncbi:MAG: hypothetical protein R3C17_18750 [Planctomycetaceae bacterium]